MGKLAYSGRHAVASVGGMVRNGYGATVCPPIQWVGCRSDTVLLQGKNPVRKAFSLTLRLLGAPEEI